MAAISKAASAVLDVAPFGMTPGQGPATDNYLRPPGHRIGPFVAGEALGHLDACYIKSDGMAYRSIGTSAGAPAAKVHGYAIGGAASGTWVYLSYDIVVFYAASGLTPGAWCYLSATAGALDTAPSTGGTGMIGLALDGQRILLQRSTY